MENALSVTSPKVEEATHKDVVEHAAKWLQKKHAVVITELVTSGECADAIGWRGAHSTLVECKVSRADFLADQKKYFRQRESLGMGCHRYYLAPAGLLSPDELPPKWGLLELTAKKVKVVKESEVFEANGRHEIGVLLSSLRRIGQASPAGISVRCYTFQTECTATIGVSENTQQALQTEGGE